MKGTVDKDTFINWRRTDPESATLFHEWVNARLGTIVCEEGIVLHAVNVHVDDHVCRIDVFAMKPNEHGSHTVIDNLAGHPQMRTYHFVIFGNPPPTWPPGVRSG